MLQHFLFGEVGGVEDDVVMAGVEIVGDIIESLIAFLVVLDALSGSLGDFLDRFCGVFFAFRNPSRPDLMLGCQKKVDDLKWAFFREMPCDAALDHQVVLGLHELGLAFVDGALELGILLDLARKFLHGHAALFREIAENAADVELLVAERRGELDRQGRLSRSWIPTDGDNCHAAIVGHSAIFIHCSFFVRRSGACFEYQISSGDVRGLGKVFSVGGCSGLLARRIGKGIRGIIKGMKEGFISASSNFGEVYGNDFSASENPQTNILFARKLRFLDRFPRSSIIPGILWDGGLDGLGRFENALNARGRNLQDLVKSPERPQQNQDDVERFVKAFYAALDERGRESAMNQLCASF